MGISFYTFQTLSYTMDVYRGKRKAERHLGYFALYVTFFPQLVAGPIERSDRLLPQLRQKHKISYQNTMDGVLRICWGFFKKIVIADRVALMVNAVYNDLPTYTGIYLIIATIGFAIQIYCDFSGYSDIAIGSAKIMGIDLMENFKMPYFSKSINEFWTRWHISLSTWFKDYLYIPLGGNRTTKRWKYYLNIMIVFLVSGFWHGAEWTFLVWGALHGIFQIAERLTARGTKKFKIPDIIKLMFTFSLVCFTWIFFRADNLQDSFYIISNLGFSGYKVFIGEKSILSLGLDNKELLLAVLSAIFLFAVDGIRYYKKTPIKNSYFTKGIMSIFLIIIIIIFGKYGANEANEFIYFQF
jgi:alginate O-acetyltransferase complex protein AlgI